MIVYLMRVEMKLRVLILMLLSILVLALTGCASLTNQKLDPEVFYKRDIRLKVNGVEFRGVAVPAPASEYKIEIETVGDINMLTLTSCHREEIFEEPTKGWFKSNTKFAYTYRPIPGIEDGQGCVLDVGAYERGRGRHSWATIDFVTPADQVVAELTCDGHVFRAKGVSICQGKQGLTQKIRFPERVKVSDRVDERCAVMRTTDDGKAWEYEMPRGECAIYFGTRDGRLHRLTTLGFESVFVRDERSE